MLNPFNSYKILEKEKYIHTITCLTLFTHAFCEMCVENLLRELVNMLFCFELLQF